MMKLRNHQPSSQLDELIPDPLSPFVDNDGDGRRFPALLICRTRKSSGMFVKGSYPTKTKVLMLKTSIFYDFLCLVLL
ncbi:hypothetical protein Hanom_Chr07g00585391 [Helianthus anomalus]